MVKDDCRQAWGLRVFDDLRSDLRFGVRGLARNPGFTATAAPSGCNCSTSRNSCMSFEAWSGAAAVPGVIVWTMGRALTTTARILPRVY